MKLFPEFLVMPHLLLFKYIVWLHMKSKCEENYTFAIQTRMAEVLFFLVRITGNILCYLSLPCPQNHQLNGWEKGGEAFKDLKRK